MKLFDISSVKWFFGVMLAGLTCQLSTVIITFTWVIIGEPGSFENAPNWLIALMLGGIAITLMGTLGIIVVEKKDWIQHTMKKFLKIAEKFPKITVTQFFLGMIGIGISCVMFAIIFMEATKTRYNPPWWIVVLVGYGSIVGLIGVIGGMITHRKDNI